jgi:hypothetical protein
MKLTAKRVREVLDYDPETGLLRWKLRLSKNTHVGDIAGSLHPQGYTVVTIGEKQYQGHRLAWCHYYGRWPRGGLDHKDAVRNNNAIDNLRRATNVQQNRNRKLSPKNKAGFKGVSWSYNCFRAFVYDGPKRIDLGRFATAEAAHQAYCAEAQRRFGEFWRAA